MRPRFSKLLFFLVFFGITLNLFSQELEGGKKDNPFNINNNPVNNRGNNNGEFNDREIGEIKRAPIDLYKIITKDRDTTIVDTTLSIFKDHRFNYLRRDDFNLLPFSNVGQTYNTLVYDFDQENVLPLFVAQSHHFNYTDAEDISYYNVPTPLTELYFKTAIQQGQQLDAFFTVNTSKRFNFSVAYKGVRSLGNYQQMLTSTGNFRFTTNYTSTNKRYSFRGHIVAQDVLNQENGGLTDNSVLLFENNDPEFEDRGRLDVNFENAENKLEGLRFYGINEYALIRKNDSTDTSSLTLGSILSYEDKFYEYRQTAPFSGFGDSYELTNLKKTTKLEDFRAQGYAKFENAILGELSASIGYTNFNYGYNSILDLAEGRITNRLKGSLITAGATYRKFYKGFELIGRGKINISGDFDANLLYGSAGYALNDDIKGTASIKIHSAAPNFNFLLNQSDYVNYNWQTNFNNVKTQELKFAIESDKFANASVSYTGIDDYAYFTIRANDSTPTPNQFSGRVDYLKIRLEKTFRYKTFGLENTIVYQNPVSGEEVFNVPQLVTRNTLYYQDEWFKKALFVQTGISFKYFTSYNMNAYDPVLAEFYVQNDQELGGFPVFDLFFNGKVRQTRIYFKYENIGALFTGNGNAFSAPRNPYRDPVLRFGLVWNFFL